jgi:hypothetical protein
MQHANITRKLGNDAEFFFVQNGAVVPDTAALASLKKHEGMVFLFVMEENV